MVSAFAPVRVTQERYRRMRSRLGAPKAITATAYKLARIFYHLWTHGGGC